jgi:hypothetical protein
MRQQIRVASQRRQRLGAACQVQREPLPLRGVEPALQMGGQ